MAVKRKKKKKKDESKVNTPRDINQKEIICMQVKAVKIVPHYV